MTSTKNQPITDDSLPCMNAELMYVTTFGRSIIRNQQEAQQLEPLIQHLKGLRLINFSHLSDTETIANFEDVSITTCGNQSMFDFHLYDYDGSLLQDLQTAAAIIERAASISSERLPITGWTAFPGHFLQIIEIAIIISSDEQPPDSPAILHQPELTTRQTTDGRLFHHALSWSEDELDEPDLEQPFTLRSRTLLPTNRMPSAAELTELMKANYTLAGLRFLGETPRHDDYAAAWRPTA